MSDDNDIRDLLDSIDDDQRRAGMAHIASSLSDFRVELLKVGFDEDQSYELARDFFNGLMDAGMLATFGESEE